MNIRRSISIFFLAGMLTAGLYAAPVLTLAPGSGSLSGLPGTTVGWGLTLANPTDFLVVTGASFTPAPLTFFGSFEDYISTGPLIVVGPDPESPVLSQDFDVAARTGVGAFHIAPTAAGSISGAIVINYALFSRSPNDPDFNPDTDLLVADAALRAPATVSIVPEPATAVLWGLGALGLGLISRKRGK